MKRVLCSLIILLSFMAAGVLLYADWQLRSVLEQPLQLEQERLLDVPSGSTPLGLFNRLQEDGVIGQTLWLRLHWKLNEKDARLHVGEYRMTPGMTIGDLIALWKSGEVVQYRLTLVEGWNFRQLRAALAAATPLEQSIGELSDAELMQRLGLDGHPEGRFFPDTYSYVRGMSDLDVLRRAAGRLQQVLDEEWGQRAEGLPYRSPYEALIMASLIEKETGVPQERPEIAGVFIRRLKIGMLLQTDPAVIYGLGERYQGNLTRAHLRQPTPYNTYTEAGLPPTPIAMVGREAINAALHPADGDTLYFVARGDGSHVFSRNLADHNRAVRDYQLKRRAGYRSSPAPSGETTQ